MIFVKYISKNEVNFARNPIFVNGLVYSNPNADILKMLGYKELIVQETPQIEEGEYLKPIYIDNDNNVTQTWEIVNEPTE